MIKGLLITSIGYLAGSIPFSYLMGRFIGGKDVRREGSGNVGATNVFRVAGRKAGYAAAAGDVLKSLLPVLAARYVGIPPFWAAATAGAVIIGHCYPVWLRFSGGKGVASAITVFLVLYWPAALVFGAVWLVLFFSTRIVSVASVLATFTFPVTMAAAGKHWSYVALSVGVAIFITYRHRSNLMRLAGGTESKM